MPHHVLSALRCSSSLSVRNADMRDHDDLVSIFELQNTSVRARFGEFFIAGLITSASAEPSQKMSLVALDYESYALEYRANEANAIRKPVSFLYVERCNPQSSEDAKTIENLKKSHCLERYSLHKIPHEDLGFIRATATLPIAESRCGNSSALSLSNGPLSKPSFSPYPLQLHAQTCKCSGCSL